MPRTAITVATTTRSGATHTWVAGDSVNGHEFDNTTQKVLVIIDNTGSANPITPTFITPATVDSSLTVGDLAGAACAAGAVRIYGPFGNTYYGQDTSPKKVYFDVAGTTASDAEIACVAVGSI